MASDRIVVVDVETSGLNPLQDSLIAVGAVAVHDSRIEFEDSFYAVVRQTQPSSAANIVVHGIGGTEQLHGAAPAEVLEQWLRYAADAPAAGFHVDFDRLVIERDVRKTLGQRVRMKWLDLATLLPVLFPEEAGITRSLDEWTKLFGIEIYQRHNALSDALATAQLLQVALARAAREGAHSVKQIVRLERDARWLASHQAARHPWA